MQMAPSEIITSYNQAKHRGEQVKILAELNACSEDDIIQILRDGGVNGKCLPRGKRIKSNEEGQPTNKQSSPKKPNAVRAPKVHVTTNADCLAYIQSLHKRRSELKNEIKLIDQELSTFQRAAAVPIEGGSSL